MSRDSGYATELGLTSENLMEVLVNFEPIGKGPKDEEEQSQTKEQDPRQHTASVPDLSGLFGNQTMLWKTEKMVYRYRR